MKKKLPVALPTACSLALFKHNLHIYCAPIVYYIISELFILLIIILCVIYVIYIFFVHFLLVNIVHVPCILNMLEGPGEENHSAYRATFFK